MRKRRKPETSPANPASLQRQSAAFCATSMFWEPMGGPNDGNAYFDEMFATEEGRRDAVDDINDWACIAVRKSGRQLRWRRLKIERVRGVRTYSQLKSVALDHVRHLSEERAKRREAARLSKRQIVVA